MRFEIYYSDGVMHSGSTKEDWLALPDDDVQFLVVEWPSGMQEKITAVDEYELFGVKKYGRWTDRENYDRIVRYVDECSVIFNEYRHGGGDKE